jgi:hypothetical protein
MPGSSYMDPRQIAIGCPDSSHVRTEVEYAAEVRMRDFAAELHFALEPGGRGRGCGDLRPNQFEGDALTKLRVKSPEYLSHAPRSQRTHDAKTARDESVWSGLADGLARVLIYRHYIVLARPGLPAAPGQPSMQNCVLMLPSLCVTTPTRCGKAPKGFQDAFSRQPRAAALPCSAGTRVGVNPVHGGFGLLNLFGIAKPAYRAFQLLHALGSEFIDVHGTHPTVDAWVVRKDHTATVATTNFAMPVIRFRLSRWMCGWRARRRRVPPGSNASMRITPIRGGFRLAKGSAAVKIRKRKYNAHRRPVRCVAAVTIEL